MRSLIIIEPCAVIINATPPLFAMPCTFSRPGVEREVECAAALPSTRPLFWNDNVWPEAVLVVISLCSVGLMSDMLERSEVTVTPLHPESMMAGGGRLLVVEENVVLLDCLVILVCEMRRFALFEGLLGGW